MSSERPTRFEPLRQDLTILPPDDPGARKVGWTVREFVGVGVVNPRGLSWRWRARVWVSGLWGRLVGRLGGRS